MIALRPEVKKDDLFIEAVYRCTREAELNFTNWPEQQKHAFVIMQSMAQLAEYKTKFPGASFQVIIYKKKDAGRFYTCENENEIRLIDITVLPQFRSKGIASFLLEGLIKKSTKAQKKITLHVDSLNPALQLYLRFGFVHIKNNGRYYFLERSPSLQM
jgi:ribosomal protein S18 acetylase RimI-like enzyme